MNPFSKRNRQKILCVFAHRDDHIVCGWPVIQNPNPEKYLFVCTNDATDVVVKSCDVAGVHHMGSAHFESGFALPNRNFKLNDNKENRLHSSNYTVLKNVLLKVVDEIKPDIIFTHNPMGEYGHLDHRFVFEVVYNELEIPIIITDIASKSSYYHKYDTIPKIYNDLYHTFIKFVPPDYIFYTKHCKIFSEFDLWTQNINLNIPLYPKRTGLYWLNHE